MKTWARTWWCRGGGAAVLMLLVVVSVFRAPRDVIFWAAVAFFVSHTALTARRYWTERRHRTTATVTHVHDSDKTPARKPVVSVFMPLPMSFQQTKNIP